MTTGKIQNWVYPWSGSAAPPSVACLRGNFAIE